MRYVLNSAFCVHFNCFVVLVTLAISLSPAIARDLGSASGLHANEAHAPSELNWLTDYAQAYAAAESEQRMLLVHFTATAEEDETQRRLDQWIESDVAVRAKLQEFILVRLPQDAKIVEEGEPIRLIDHAAFRTLGGFAGIAMIDLRDPAEGHYGQVVTILPHASGKYYRWRESHLRAALDLPSGTLSQRTLIWAVRVHPEAPQSTIGAQHAVLTHAATEHSAYQAQTGVQGHQRFEQRAERIRDAAGSSEASEVVAESWPNEGLVDACIDCVASWRQSPGHWGAVRKRHRLFGYDIRRGRNGIWYATGIFAN
jgi:hypothetical protein